MFSSFFFFIEWFSSFGSNTHKGTCGYIACELLVNPWVPCRGSYACLCLGEVVVILHEVTWVHPTALTWHPWFKVTRSCAHAMFDLVYLAHGITVCEKYQTTTWVTLCLQEQAVGMGDPPLVLLLKNQSHRRPWHPLSPELMSSKRWSWKDFKNKAFKIAFWG